MRRQPAGLPVLALVTAALVARAGGLEQLVADIVKGNPSLVRNCCLLKYILIVVVDLDPEDHRKVIHLWFKILKRNIIYKISLSLYRETV